MPEAIPDFESWLYGLNVTRKVDSLVLHHTYRPTTRQYEGERTIEAIRKYHLSKGWRDIGYHVLVGPDGAIWPGRPLAWVGAHAIVHTPEMLRLLGSSSYLNKYSVGVCAIGDYDSEEPSSTLVTSLKQVLSALARRFDIPPERLFFHRQVTAKSCPGKSFDLDSVRSWLESEPAVAAWALESWRWAHTKGLIFGEPSSPSIARRWRRCCTATTGCSAEIVYE